MGQGDLLGRSFGFNSLMPKARAHLGVEFNENPVVSEGSGNAAGRLGNAGAGAGLIAQKRGARGACGNLEKSTSAGTQLLHRVPHAPASGLIYGFEDIRNTQRGKVAFFLSEYFLLISYKREIEIPAISARAGQDVDATDELEFLRRGDRKVGCPKALGRF